MGILDFINNKSQCECSIAENDFTHDELVCDQELITQVVYRAKIATMSTDANNVVSIIEQWILHGASITSGLTLVTFDPSCYIRISSFSNPVCVNGNISTVATTTTTTTTTTTSTSTVPSDTTFNVHVLYLLCGVVMVVVVMVIAVCTCVALCFRAAREKHTSIRYRSYTTGGTFCSLKISFTIFHSVYT